MQRHSLVWNVAGGLLLSAMVVAPASAGPRQRGEHRPRESRSSKSQGQGQAASSSAAPKSKESAPVQSTSKGNALDPRKLPRPRSDGNFGQIVIKPKLEPKAKDKPASPPSAPPAKVPPVIKQSDKRPPIVQTPPQKMPPKKLPPVVDPPQPAPPKKTPPKAEPPASPPLNPPASNPPNLNPPRDETSGSHNRHDRGGSSRTDTNRGGLTVRDSIPPLRNPPPVDPRIVMREEPVVVPRTPPVIDLPLIEEGTPPVDPETPPVDPNAPPVDPETPPVDPNAPPVDPEAPPVDPATPAECPPDDPCPPGRVPGGGGFGRDGGGGGGFGGGGGYDVGGYVEPTYESGAAAPPVPQLAPAAETSQDEATEIADRLTEEDDEDRVRKGCYAKVYTVALTAGQIYAIDLESPSGGEWFDPFLRIEDARGKALAQDNDGGKRMNARLVVRPARDGDYRIVVTSNRPRATGVFFLKLR